MLKSINYWNFKGGLDCTLPATDFVDKAKKAGFEAVEFTLEKKGDISLKVKENKAAEIADYAKTQGMKLASLATGLYWDYSLTDPKASKRKKAEEILKKQIDVASWMGIKHILIVPGAVDVFFKPNEKPVPYDFVYKTSQKALRKAEKYAAKKKVVICIENVWNKFLLSPLEMKDFVDSFKSRWIKVYFDLGNHLFCGYPEHWIPILGKKRIGRVHVKDFDKSKGTAEGFCDLLKGDVDFKACMKELRKIGYNGPLTAEIIPWNPGRVKRTSRAMDKIMKM